MGNLRSLMMSNENDRQTSSAFYSIKIIYLDNQLD